METFYNSINIYIYVSLSLSFGTFHVPNNVYGAMK